MTAEELVTTAERRGPVRVIVALAVEYPGPSSEAVAQTQSQLLKELAGTAHVALRRYTTIPFLGLAVSADALRRLMSSTRVIGIREDLVLEPQESSRSSQCPKGHPGRSPRALRRAPG